MGHFAKVIQTAETGANGKVEKVIVAEPEYFDTFVDSSPGRWIQCSYNTRGGVHYQPDTNIPSEDQSKALRKNYPCSGWGYSFDADAFYPPQPYPSWTLNEDTFLWDPPIPYPSNGVHYWEEETQSWKPNL